MKFICNSLMLNLIRTGVWWICWMIQNSLIFRTISGLIINQRRVDMDSMVTKEMGP